MRKQIRHTPHVVVLSGDPGVGKTFLMNEIANLCRGPNTTDKNLIYFKNPMDEFFSGMPTKVEFLAIDDAHNAKEDEVAKCLYQLVGNAEALVNQASINDAAVGIKGQRFECNGIIMSTNNTYPTPDGVIEPKALWRRRNLLFELVCKRQYADAYHKPDFDRLRKLVAEGGNVVTQEFVDKMKYLEVYQLDPMDNNKGTQRIRGPFEVQEMLAIILADYKDHHSKQKALVERLRTHALSEEVRKRDGAVGIMNMTFMGVPARIELEAQMVGEENRDEMIATTDIRACGDTHCEHLTCLLYDEQHGGRKKKTSAWAHIRRKCEIQWEEFQKNHPWIAGLLTVCGVVSACLAIVASLKWAQDKLKHIHPFGDPLHARRVELYRDILNTGGDRCPWCEGCTIDDPCQTAAEYCNLFYGSNVVWRAPPHIYRSAGKDPNCGEGVVLHWQPAEGQGMNAAYDPGSRPKGQRAVARYARPQKMQGQQLENALQYLNIKHDEGITNFVSSSVLPQVCMVTIPEMNRCLSAFRPGGHYILTARHLFMNGDGQFIPNGTRMEIHLGPNNSKHEILFHKDYLKRLPRLEGRDRDAVLYYCGNRVPAAPRMRKNFWTRTDCDLMDRGPGLLLSARPVGGNMMQHEYIFNDMHIAESVIPDYTIDGIQYKCPDGIMYTAMTAKGDCGGIVVSNKKGVQRPLCGIHVAGKGGAKSTICLAEPIFEEDLIVLDTEPQGSYIPDFVEAKPAVKFNGEGNWTYLGSLPRSHQLRNSAKTVLQKSPFYELFGPSTKQPAALDPKDPRLPEPISFLSRGAEKYAQQCKPFDIDRLKIIRSAIKTKFAQRTIGEPFILSIEQAINGIPGKEYFDALVMNTSPGYHYKIIGVKEKKELFEGEVPNAKFSSTIAGRYLKERYEERLRLAKQGINFDTITALKTKDELRPNEKFWKTRLFSVLDTDLLLLARQFTLHWSANFYHNRIKTSSIVGIDAESSEWDVMVKKALACSDVGFAGDFGRYDGMLPPEFVEAFYDMISSYYNDGFEGLMVRKVLREYMTHNVQTALDAVFQTHGGNPSGNSLTAPMNTVVQYGLLLDAWLALAPIEFRTTVAFEKYVCPLQYGDDNLVAVNRLCTDFYNMRTVSEHLAQYGLEFLPSTKDSKDFYDVKPILELDILKRFIRKEPAISHTQYVAAMNQDTITEMMYWVRDSTDHFKAAVDNVNMALRFAFFWGPQYFNQLRKRIVSFCERNNLPRPNLLQYRELLIEKHETGTISGGLHLEGQMSDVTAGGDAANVKEETVGVTHIDHVAPVSETTSGGAMTTIKSRAEGNMPDVHWDFDKMTEKSMPVWSGLWTSAQTVGTTLFQATWPQDILQNNTISIPFRNFVFFRGNLVVNLKINGSPLQQGRIIMYYCANMTKDQCADWHANNKAAQTSVPHVFGDPSTNVPIQMILPFTNMNHYVNLVEVNPNYDFIGTLNIAVFNTLRLAGTTSNQVGLSLFAHFQKSEFHIPRALGYTPTMWQTIAERASAIANVPEGQRTLKQKKTIEAAQVLEEFRRKFNDEFELLHFEGQMGSSSSKQEDNRATTENVTNNYYVDPVNQGLKNTTAPQPPGKFYPPMQVGVQMGNVDMSGGGTSSASIDVAADAQIPAMDKPSAGMNPPPLRLQAVGYLNHCQTTEWIDRFCLTPATTDIVDSEHWATDLDEMALEYLFTRMTFKTGDVTDPRYQSPISWTTAQATDTILATYALCPCEELFNVHLWDGLTNANPYYGDALCYNMAPFTFWTGGLRFRFDVICTGFHSGRLAFAPHYGVFTVPTTLSEASDQSVVYFDVSSGNHSFTVEVPWHHQKSWLNVPHGPANDKKAFAMGLASLRVVTPLIASNGVDTTVEINVFSGGAADMRSNMTFGNNRTLLPWFANTSAALEMEGQMADGDPVGNTSEMQVVDAIAGTQGRAKKDPIHFGEDVPSLQHCFKGYYPLGTFKNPLYDFLASNDGLGAGIMHGNYVRLVGIHNVMEVIQKGPVGWWSPCYRFWRGSVRFKVICNFHTRDTITDNANTRGTMENEYRSVVLFLHTNKIIKNSSGIWGQPEFGQLYGTICNIFGETGNGYGYPDPHYDVFTNLFGRTFWDDTPYNQTFVHGQMTNAFSANDGTNPIRDIQRYQANTYMPAMGFLKYSISSKYAQDHTLEIPYASAYEVLYNQCEGTDKMFSDINLYTPGCIAICAYGDQWLDQQQTQNGPIGQGVQASYMLQGALGDGFRFGIWLGPRAFIAAPLRNPTNTDIYPLWGDTYPV